MDEFDSVGSVVNHWVIDHDCGLSRWIRAQYFLYRGDRTLAHGASFLCVYVCASFLLPPIFSSYPLLSPYRFFPHKSADTKRRPFLTDTHSLPHPRENRWNSIVVTRAGRYILPFRMVWTWPRVSTRVSPMSCCEETAGVGSTPAPNRRLNYQPLLFMSRCTPSHRFETEIL